LTAIVTDHQQLRESASNRPSPSFVIVHHHYPMHTVVITQSLLIRTCRAPQ
jgi:hypothetical protein